MSIGDYFWVKIKGYYILFSVIDYSANRWRLYGSFIGKSHAVPLCCASLLAFGCQTVSSSCSDPWPYIVSQELKEKSASLNSLTYGLASALSGTDAQH